MWGLGCVIIYVSFRELATRLNWRGGALSLLSSVAPLVFHLEGKMAQCFALAETRLSRAEVLLVASIRDIALESQAGISKILYFLR
jgi:hypothetical protein